ncbi:MAG: aldehyde dehydrogenase family protein [Rhizobiaceae bacterium]|nr:aldehyde dehydrogenase family protein [Rhizobiaceae bacterium]
MAILDKRDFYINGEWVRPAGLREFHVIDAATEEPCAVISLGDATVVDKAVAAARAAFPAWAATPLADRLALMERFGDIQNRRNDEMGRAVSLEMGAPIDFATGDQAGCGPWHLDGFLAAARAFHWERPHGKGEVIVREPIGVCGLITPWNWPVNQIALKVFPALITGCTVVLKPSEVAPLSAMLFAEFIHEAGFPAGVFNLVNGDGPGVGAPMSVHPGIDMMSFTGSTRAGIAVQKAAADTVKRVTLELGGKSPNIIFADADLPSAVKRGVGHCFGNVGQSCNAPTRMIVEAPVYDQVVDLAAKAGAEIKVGNPRDKGPHIGPLTSKAQFERVQAMIEAGIAEGARLVLGGPGRPEGFNRGWFVRPTIFVDVTNDMTIAREEIFGPVLSIIKAEDENDAISIANDTPFGLAAYVQTSDPERAARVTRALRAGMVRVNGAGLSAGHPFGGYKMSGNGREGGVFGLEDFTEVKIISMRGF